MNRFLLVTMLVFSGACTFDPGLAPDTSAECDLENQCPLSSQTCISGVCVSKSTPDLGTLQDVDPVEDLGSPCVDEDNDGFFTGPLCQTDASVRDCDDTNSDIFPGAIEVCSGVDTNCDGNLKAGCDCVDGVSEGCGSNIGVCEKGMRICNGGKWGDCVGEVLPDSSDSCGDILDNNCDGNVNEGCPCSGDETTTCGSNIGACVRGVQTCVNGNWSQCEGGVTAMPEVCDGKDNDCNGEIDDNTNDTGAACVSGEPGECAGGSEVCTLGMIVCEPVNVAVAETCDGKDNDCDGSVDNGVTQTCTTACGPGQEVCSAGTFGSCVPVNPPVEVCDGMDNDCDGRVDEDVNNQLLMEACGGNSCPDKFFRLCEPGGTWSPCNRSEVEVCDGSDSNCDTLIDNRATCYMACPGGGITRGAQTCNNGISECILPPEICGDGLDNDCDGRVDQGCDLAVSDMAFVPNGTFLMGSAANDTVGQNDEKPEHLADLRSFYIDYKEVSRADYSVCVTAGACTLDTSCSYSADLTLPMTCVDHANAQAFCNYVGKRLPTEAEWEKAARGPFGREVIYPWGDMAQLSRANMDCHNGFNQCLKSVDSFQNGMSYYSLLHMSGNAVEWTQDYYDFGFYTSGVVTDPVNTTMSPFRVLRGGAYNQSIDLGRVSNRARSDIFDKREMGFRCAKDF